MWQLCPTQRGWTGRAGYTGIRGRGTGVKGTGEEGSGIGNFLGAGLYQNLLYFTYYFPIFMYFNAITGYQKYLTDELK